MPNQSSGGGNVLRSGTQPDDMLDAHTTTPEYVLEARIALRATQLARGKGQEGHSLANWLSAAKEILSDRSHLR